MSLARGGVIGIIGEDKSDVASLKLLTKRISGRSDLKFKPKSANGCGALMRKCTAWADLLFNGGCDLLIVAHDSDKNDPQEIAEKLKAKLISSLFTNHVVVVPTQEIEAWLLSDPLAIKKAMKLDKLPNIKSNIESIVDPKEYLEVIVDRFSNGRRTYNYTLDNDKIASIISFNEIRKKCASFNTFFDYIVKNI
jgi:hypothetical protein